MLLNKKLKLILISSIILIILPIAYSQQTCTATEIKDALRKALFDYFESSATSQLSVNEIKDFLRFYLSISTDKVIVDCSGSGPLSGKPYYLMLGAARNIDRGIPKCSDGTEYGKCSANVPNYCYGGKLEERCKICGCGEGQNCDLATNKCIVSAAEQPAQGQGKLVLAITDAPVLDYSALIVTISNVEVHKDGKWISFPAEKTTFDLLQLADAADVIGKNNIPAGHYTQIRFQVVETTVKLVDGTASSVKVPSGEIKLVNEFDVDEGKTTYLYLDFKPESLKKAGDSYILQPVIKVMALSEFKEDLCENRAVSCDDANPCTADSCDAGFCSSTPVADGTSCGTGYTCFGGNCVLEAQVACSKLNFTTSNQKIFFQGLYVGWKGSSVLVDLDGDNDPDIVQGAIPSDEEYSWLPGYFYLKAKVLFNDGKGNFTDSGQFLGKATIWSAAGDIDGDGDNDVVTGTWGGGSMRVYFNDGKGYFTDSQQKLGGWIDFFPSLADFDGDGDLDLYAPIWPFHSPQSHVFLNDGKGFFSEYLESGLNIPGWGVYSGKAVFDIDKDKDIDIVEVSWNGTTMHTRILKNNGKAQFTVSQELKDVGGAVGVADFDNDNDSDFIASSVFINDGNGVFSVKQSSSGSYSIQQYYDPYHYAAVADIDKNRGADFMYAYFPQAELNNGDATFFSCRLPDLYKVNYDTKTYYEFFPYELGDIDGDGDADMVGPAYSGSYYWDNNLSLSVAFNNLIK